MWLQFLQYCLSFWIFSICTLSQNKPWKQKCSQCSWQVRKYMQSPTILEHLLPQIILKTTKYMEKFVMHKTHTSLSSMSAANIFSLTFWVMPQQQLNFTKTSLSIKQSEHLGIWGIENPCVCTHTWKQIFHSAPAGWTGAHCFVLYHLILQQQSFSCTPYLRQASHEPPTRNPWQAVGKGLFHLFSKSQ